MWSPVTEGKKRLFQLARRIARENSPPGPFRTRHGFRMELNLRNPEHERMFYYGEHDERYEIRAVSKLIAPNAHCWDIGANVGFYTCLFAKLAPAGQVHAFEPGSGSYVRLQHNVMMNHFPNVTLHRSALSSQEGEALLHARNPELCEGTACLEGFAEDQSHTESVRTTTMNALRQSLGTPEFIKMDVEGHQLEVLRGANELLAISKPTLFVEMQHSCPDVVLKIDSLLMNLGYLFYDFKKHGLLPVRHPLESRCANQLAVHPESPSRAKIKPLLVTR